MLRGTVPVVLPIAQRAEIAHAIEQRHPATLTQRNRRRPFHAVLRPGEVESVERRRIGGRLVRADGRQVVALAKLDDRAFRQALVAVLRRLSFCVPGLKRKNRLVCLRPVPSEKNDSGIAIQAE